MLQNFNNYLTAINNAKIVYVTSQDRNFTSSNIISQEQKVRKNYLQFIENMVIIIRISPRNNNRCI